MNVDRKASAQADLGASIARVIRSILMQLECMLPARVVTVDRAAGRVSVQPMIMAGTIDNKKVSRPMIVNIPIMTSGAGGIFASFPVRPGDLGFVFAADRDTSLFYQGEGGEDWPNTERLHEFADGGFLPLKLFNFAIAGGVEADGFALQTEDGQTFVTLKAGEVQIQAAHVVITGDVSVTGDIDHTGDQTTSGDVVASGISLASHTHGGVQAGSSNTGGPQ